LRPKTLVFAAYLAAVTLAASIITIATSVGSAVGQSGSTTLLIDVRVQNNTPSNAGDADFCVSIDEGDEIDVDVLITGVDDLLSWEATLVHDRAILEIVEQDVRMFIASEPGSNPLDASEPLPDVNGRHLLAIGDVSSATDSGSGTLGRVRFKAISEGVSRIAIPQRDINGDGRIDEGALLTQAGGGPIGDTNGDRFFDGPVAPGFVVVGASCNEITPEPTPPPGTGGGSTIQPTTTADGGPGTNSPRDGVSPGGPAAQQTTDASPGASPDSEPETSGSEDGVGGPGGQGGSGPDANGGDGGSSIPIWVIVLAIGAVVAGGGAAILAFRRASRPSGDLP
jgi:hypothetical protein